MRLLAKKPIVVGMAANPEPHKDVDGLDRKCPIATSNPSGPETTYSLELKRRMIRIVFEVRIRPIGEPLDLWRYGSVADPEVR